MVGDGVGENKYSPDCLDGIYYHQQSTPTEATSMCIREFLQARLVRFEVLLHPPSHSATHLAGSVHVPGRSVAKAVLVRSGDGFALAVLPRPTGSTPSDWPKSSG